MIILGVDPGLRASGVAVAEGGGRSFNVRCLEEVKTESSESLPERINFIFSSLENVVDRFKPSVLVLEKIYSHYRHPTTAALLGEVRGIVILLSAVKKMKLIEFPATYVKKSITSRGSASKEQVRRMVSYLSDLKKPLRSQHLADALALVIAYLHTQK